MLKNKKNKKNKNYRLNARKTPKIIYITKNDKNFNKNKYIIKDILQETNSEVYFYCDNIENVDGSIFKNGKINSTFFKGGLISNWRNLSNIMDYIQNKKAQFVLVEQNYPKKNVLIPILAEKNITVLESTLTPI